MRDDDREVERIFTQCLSASGVGTVNVHIKYVHKCTSKQMYVLVRIHLMLRQK